MNYTALQQQVMSDEGFRAKPYLDTVGIATVGYGSIRILGRDVQLYDPDITPDNARQLLRADLYGALVDAQALFSRFDEMDGVRQGVLANMAYNLGRHRLGKFKRMIDAAEKLDYVLMSEEMVLSKWYLQVGNRGVRLANEMKTGETT